MLNIYELGLTALHSSSKLKSSPVFLPVHQHKFGRCTERHPEVLQVLTRASKASVAHFWMRPFDCEVYSCVGMSVQPRYLYLQDHRGCTRRWAGNSENAPWIPRWRGSHPHILRKGDAPISDLITIGTQKTQAKNFTDAP